MSQPGAPKYIREWLSWGAGPRAVQNLIIASKARALLFGRSYVMVEDIKEVALPVLRHRLATNFTAASEGVTAETVIKRMLEETPSKEGELERDDRFKKIFAK